ncbi:tetratricopeptide repeat protein [bacterium]|nr:tetratricopeptide repeat protein [bacterium]
MLALVVLAPLLLGWMNPLRDVTRQGLRQYLAGEYDAAIQSYLDAELRAPEDARLAFSRGTINYKMGKYEAAAEEFARALSTDDPRLRAAVHYNLGNVKFREEDYPSAINEYIEALKLAPDHADAKFNLELARKRLKEQIDKNKQQQEQQQQQQQQNQEQQQQQQSGEQKDEQQEEQQQQQQKAEGKEEEEKQAAAGQENTDEEKPSGQQAQEEPRQAEEISPEEAERILRNLARDEMEKRREMQRRRATRVGNPEKDW